MAKFNSKSFNPQAFGAYVERIPNVTKSELTRSGAVGVNENARAALSNQTGAVYARVPYFGRISASTSQNNDGASDITAATTTTYEQGFVVASRMDSWTERSFSKNITAGTDFMDNVAAQIADYKAEVKQGILLKMLKGIFSMPTTGNTLEATSAAEFIQKHTYDVTSTETGKVDASTLNSAIYQACGDNKSAFKLVIMHSAVATGLENLNLFKFLTYTDKDGITRDLNLGTWNGRTVLVDDTMPVETVGTSAGVYEVQITTKAAEGDKIKINEVELTAGTDFSLTTDTAAGNAEAIAAALNASEDESVSGYTWSSSGAKLKATEDEGHYGDGAFTASATKAPSTGTLVIDSVTTATAPLFVNVYTTYILGEGSIVLDNIGDSVPYEMSRDPKTNGGMDTLYVRDRYICGVEGFSFEKPVTVVASAANSDLENGENWCIINDGTTAVPHKSIAVARIISKG